MTLVDVEKLAFTLSQKDRAALALNLIQTLEESEEGNVEELWIQEAKTRLDNFEKGKIKAIPEEEVMRKAKDNLQR